MERRDLSSNITATWVLGVIIVAILAFIFYLGNTIGPKLEDEMARTQSIAASISLVAQSDTDYIFNLEYRYNDNKYGKNVSCEIKGCATEYMQGLITGKVTLWLDPKEPNGALINKPYVVVCYLLVLMYWGVILYLIVLYGTFLYKTWITREN